MIAGCSTDYGALPGLGGAAGARTTPQFTTSASASIHLAALHALQQSPAHAFIPHGPALRARVGPSAAVTLAGDRLTLDPDAHDFALGLRTTRIGRGFAAAPAPRLEATNADGQELILARSAVEERYLAGPLNLER